VNIAQYGPRHVFSGSTDGLVAQSAYYSEQGDCECLACNHPVPSFELQAEVERLRALGEQGRLAYYESREVDASVFG
jgi:hypothetical protein